MAEDKEKKKTYGYLDIVPHYDYKTDEEWEKAIAEADERSRKLKEPIVI